MTGGTWAITQERGEPGAAPSCASIWPAGRAQDAYERATALAEEAVALMREVGAKQNEAMALITLGTMALEQGDHGRATTRTEEGLALFQEQGAPWGCALALTILGDAARDQGEQAHALARYAENLALRQGRRWTAWRAWRG